MADNSSFNLYNKTILSEGGNQATCTSNQDFLTDQRRTSVFGSPLVFLNKSIEKRCLQPKTIFQTLIPTAHCCSHIGNKAISSEFDSEDQESLPGFHTKSRANKKFLPNTDEISNLEINRWLNQETGFQRLQQENRWLNQETGFQRLQQAYSLG